MRLTFADSPNIDPLNFRRLLLIADELVFVDRPSISLANNFGTVGMPSWLRSIQHEFEGSEIKLIVDEPPNTTFNSQYYRQYYLNDMDNPEFLNTIFEGIKNNWIYDPHFDPKDKHCEGDYIDYRKWLIENKNEIMQTSIVDLEMTGEPFRIANKNEALFAFKIITAEQSLRVTSIIHICNKYNNSPISINPYLDKLINLRLSNAKYVGQTQKSRSLGFKIMDCMIPDAALTKISIDDILEFREKTSEYYKNWTIEINKIESQLFINQGISNSEVSCLLDVEINPRLRELNNEIRRIRDDRFKNILKTIKNTFLSFVSLGTLSSLSIPGAIALFVGNNLKTPKLTDEIIEAHFQLKDKKLSNGLTYLLEVQEYLNQ